MNTRALAAAVLVFVMVARAYAGHGVMNSFADVESLPEPGCLPHEWCYPFDTFAEHVMLFVARVRGDALDYALTTAREKLAEVSAMIKRHDVDAAARARDRYIALSDAAADAVAGASDDLRPEHRDRYMNAVLEHVYILTVDYVDMPLDIRRDALRPVFDHAMAAFADVRASLSERAKKALFFTEEEIRWALEMAEQADVQKITNEFAGD